MRPNEGARAGDHGLGTVIAHEDRHPLTDQGAKCRSEQRPSTACYLVTSGCNAIHSDKHQSCFLSLPSCHLPANKRMRVPNHGYGHGDGRYTFSALDAYGDCTAPPPPPAASPPPPAVGIYRTTDYESCNQAFKHFECESKVTEASCVAATDCHWFDYGEFNGNNCYYDYHADNEDFFDAKDHYADRDYTSREDIEAMPATIMCGGKSMQECSGDCTWVMTYDSDYDYSDGISEREGQCYPTWPLIKEELLGNGAPAGVIGHWRYEAYNLVTCVAETKSSCEEIVGCVWNNHCLASRSVEAKSLDSECGDYDLGFSQYYDASTPMVVEYTSDAKIKTYASSFAAVCISLMLAY